MKKDAVLVWGIDALLGLAVLLLLGLVALALHDVHNVLVAMVVIALAAFAAPAARVHAGRRNWLCTGALFSAGFVGPMVGVGFLGIVLASHAGFWLVVLGLVFCALLGAGGGALLRWRRWAWTVVVLLLCVACAVGMGRIVQNAFSAVTDSAHATDKPAPAFVLHDATGQQFNNQTLSGHVVVLDFWATWCGACMAEMPPLGQVQQRFTEDAQVRFYAVNPEMNEKDEKAIAEFADWHRVSASLLFDPQAKTFHAMGGSAMPYLVLLDKRGKMRWVSTGYDSAAAFETELTNEIRALEKEK